MTEISSHIFNFNNQNFNKFFKLVLENFHNRVINKLTLQNLINII